MAEEFYATIEMNSNTIENFGYEVVATLPASGAAVGHILAVGTAAPYVFNQWDGVAWVVIEDTDTTYTATAPIQISASEVITIDAATDTTPGSMSAADKEKLDDATNAATASTLVERDASGNAEVAYPTANSHIATKKYVDDQIVELGAFAGGWDASAGLPTTGTGGAGEIDSGDYWYATVGGTIAGLVPSTTVEVGDVLTATTDGASAAADFIVMQRNMEVDETPYVQSYNETLTFASGVTQTITHNLNNATPQVTIIRSSNNRQVNGRVTVNGVNAVDVRLTGNNLPLAFTIVVHG